MKIAIEAGLSKAISSLEVSEGKSTSNLTKLPKRGYIDCVLNGLETSCALTESDVWTFVLPETLFGVIGVLSGPVLTTTANLVPSNTLLRLPLILTFTWTNLLIFNLANQRNAGIEDVVNKPYRPIPSGRLTPLDMRRILLGSTPVVLAISYFMGVWEETALLFVLTWMSCDLAGGDEHYVIRNLIIALAFALYNLGALRVACWTECFPNNEAYFWIAILTGVIFTSTSVQDLKDQEGDKAKGRLTAPLVLGDTVARWTVAVPWVLWSFLCPLYLEMEWTGYVVPVGLGLLGSGRTLALKKPKIDQRTYGVWAGWMICLYCLPLVKKYDGVWSGM